MSRRFQAAFLVTSAASLPALAAEGGGNPLVNPVFGLSFWTLVTFVLLAFGLGRIAWKPLLSAVEARERGIRETLDRASQDRQEAEALVAEHRDLVSEARRERAEAVAQGQRDAERLKEEILDEARRQREQLLRQTEEQVQAGMRQARDELRGVAADLAIRAAERLLAESLDEPAHRKLVEEHLADLERGSGGAAAPS